MDSPVHPAAAQKGVVCGIDYGLDVQPGDIGHDQGEAVKISKICFHDQLPFL